MEGRAIIDTITLITYYPLPGLKRGQTLLDEWSHRLLSCSNS
jgi:hypothetical protein